MKKAVLLVVAVIAGVVAYLLLGHNQYTDYLNPTIKMESDYARVPKSKMPTAKN